MSFEAAQLRVDVLEEFALLHYKAARDLFSFFEPSSDRLEAARLEAVRRAYRRRNLGKGLCVYCPEAHVEGGTLCLRHLDMQRQRARRYQKRRARRCQERPR
jgi:hypothetical protein